MVTVSAYQALFVFATFALLLSSSSADSCSAYTTCSGCTDIGGCGYCEATGTCMEGQSSGPTNGTCTSGWDWIQTSCPGTCSQHTDCTSCSNDPSCGYCKSSGQCVDGTSSGPSSTYCMSKDWYFSYDQCLCLSYQSSCSTCVPVGGCGWCSSTNECRYGSSTGPDDSSLCTSSDWKWTITDCGSGCSEYYSCSSCTSAAGCGWCPSSYMDDDFASIQGTCYAGQSIGPSGSNYCYTNWVYYSSSCPTGYQWLGMGIVAFVFVVILLPAFIIITIGAVAGVATRRARLRRMQYVQVGRAAPVPAYQYRAAPVVRGAQPQPNMQPYYPPPAAQPVAGNPYQRQY